MRIEQDIKLDFKDVLIRPKRSKLSSRKEVDLTRSFTFKHSKFTWTGVPIMASNMDGVGTLAMAHALETYGMFTCIVKTENVNNWSNINSLYLDFMAISTGTGPNDVARLEQAFATNKNMY